MNNGSRVYTSRVTLMPPPDAPGDGQVNLYAIGGDPNGVLDADLGDRAFEINGTNTWTCAGGNVWAASGGGGGIGGTIGVNEVAFGTALDTIGGDPAFLFDGVNLTVATGGSAIDIGQGFITGGANLTVETMLGGTLTLGNGNAIDLVAADEIRVNGATGAAGDVLTSNGAGVPPTWQAPAPSGITQLTGDVTAGPGAGSQPASVVALQGNAVSSAVPADGQVLTWNGSAWVPGAAASGGSGGGGQTYFLNAGTPGGPPIVGLPGSTKQFGLTAEVALTSITSAVLPIGGVFAVVAGFVTDLGAPGLTAIPAGVWDFNVWAQSSALAPNTVLFRINVYTYDGVAATLIATGATTPLYDPTSLVQYIASTLLPQTPVLVTDRVYVEIEATSTLAGQTITVDFGGTTPTHAHTTLPSVAGTGIVHVINGVMQSPASPVDLTAGATEISGTLPISNGGTGTSTVPANGELLIGNGAGYSLATLTDGSNIIITDGAGSITIDAVPSGAANEVQYNNGGTTFGADPGFTYDGNVLTVATGGSSIDVGLGFVTGNPNLTIETGAGGTLTLGNGDNVDLVAASEIRVNGATGAAGEVLTSNGPGVPPTWQAGGGGTIGGTIAANEVAFGTGADTIGGSANFTWDNATSALAIVGDAADCLTVASLIDGQFLAVSPTSYTLTITDPLTPTSSATMGPGDVAVGDGAASGNVQAGYVGVTENGTGNRITLTAPAGLGTLTSEDSATFVPTPLNVVCEELRVNGAPGAAGEVLTSNGAGLAPTWQAVAGAAINQLTQDVIAGPGSGSQAAKVQGMGGSTSKIHFVIVGGKYATLQDAVNAAAANDTILVGPIGAVSPVTSWGDVTFPAQKRLTVIGLTSPRSYGPNIGKVTFAPAAGLNILENTVHLENLFINASFAGAQGVNFAGTAPARLRMVNCYIYNLSAVSGNAVVVNNSGAGSSCYLDGTTIQGAGTAGVGVNHVQGYTLIRNGSEVADYQYQIQCAAGTVEVYNSQIQGSLANEVIRITGGTVFLGYSTIRNTTANSTGVNLVNAGAAFGMGDATFAIATGTGYCVNGVAGSIFLYGPITYSNSAALAYNVKVKNTISAFPVTQAFTLSP